MSDKILIRQLEIHTIIGIHDWEKKQTQPLLLDMDLNFDCLPAAQSDDITDALDYFAVCQQVTSFTESSHFELIETLAEKVAGLVLREFNCRKIKLTVFKPQAIKNAQTVGVRIVRKNHR